MSVIPSYTEISKGKVRCSICGLYIKCRKYEEYRLRDLDYKSNIKKGKDDWICIICESKYMSDEYARLVAE